VCDAEAHTIQKLIVSNLYEITHPGSEASRSPAYDTTKAMKFSDLQIESMFRNWYRRNIDRWNYDPRDSVCAWAAENLSLLQRNIPDSHPRSIAVQKFGRASSYAAMAVAIIAMFSVGAVLAFTWKNRSENVFVYAQPNFLFMLLFGLALVCIGAILFSTKPSIGSCIARPWFVILGSSLQIVPLIVKVAAINKVCQETRRMIRTTIRPKMLYKATGVIMGLVSLYLLIWTFVDPYTLQTDKELTSFVNEDGGKIVQITYFCASSSSSWSIISFSYQFLLLVAATVLAFQNQNADTMFNESFRLALVIYSHFLFTLLRAILWIFRTKLEDHYVVSIASSFLLSLDALAGLGIYFLPKVKAVIMPGTSLERSPGTHLSCTVEQIVRNAERNQQPTPSSTKDGSDNDILPIDVEKKKIERSPKISEMAPTNDSSNNNASLERNRVVMDISADGDGGLNNSNHEDDSFEKFLGYINSGPEDAGKTLVQESELTFSQWLVTSTKL